VHLSVVNPKLGMGSAQRTYPVAISGCEGCHMHEPTSCVCPLSVITWRGEISTGGGLLVHGSSSIGAGPFPSAVLSPGGAEGAAAPASAAAAAAVLACALVPG
jgi:hypothetical protein